jgi:hypothetical protein
MSTIWVNGTDTVTAIFPFNASLVVCGLKHIVFFTDGSGSMLGLNPQQAYVFDVLVGTGCLSQWTVAYEGEADVIFLSPNGVQSLSRLQQNRDNPLGTLTKYVRDTLLADVSAETIASNLQGAYNPSTGTYYLVLPYTGKIYVLDVRRKYTDEVGEVCARVTTWSVRAYSVYVDHNNVTWFGVAQLSGTTPIAYIAQLGQTYADYTGVSYAFQWQSPWMDFSQEGGAQVGTHLKMLKRMEAVVYSAGNQTLQYSFNADFSTSPGTYTVTQPAAGLGSQYGVAQYGYDPSIGSSAILSQYGGNSALLRTSYDARAKGQFYQFGISQTVSAALALQQVQYVAKVGRIA